MLGYAIVDRTSRQVRHLTSKRCLRTTRLSRTRRATWSCATWLLRYANQVHHGPSAF